MNAFTLEVIRDNFAALGPQSFSDILHEVRTQCPGVDGLAQSYDHTKEHLEYLLSLGSVVKQSDEFGIVYGLPSDF